MVLTTARLVFRELTHEDLESVAAILQDAETMAVWKGPFTDEAVVAWLDTQLARYAEFGFGLYAAVLRDTGQVIGQCGITWQDIDGVRRREVGYLFNRAFWHRGFAVEAASAMRDWAFNELGTDDVWAQVRFTNLASMNVAIRCGMVIRCSFIKNYGGEDIPHLGFAITRGEWQEQKAVKSHSSDD